MGNPIFDSKDYKYKNITEKIIKCYYEVYNELGHGFLESVYEKSFMISLQENGLNAIAQKEISVYFHGKIVGNYKTDIIVEDKIILELKAAKKLDRSHEAQLLNYLKATNLEVGLLFNFSPKPEFKRFVFSNK